MAAHAQRHHDAGGGAGSDAERQRGRGRAERQRAQHQERRERLGAALADAVDDRLDAPTKRDGKRHVQHLDAGAMHRIAQSVVDRFHGDAGGQPGEERVAQRGRAEGERQEEHHAIGADATE